MSLLLEALKQAALEKRRKKEGGEEPATPADPVSTTGPGASPVEQGVEDFLLHRAEGEAQDSPSHSDDASEAPAERQDQSAFGHEQDQEQAEFPDWDDEIEGEEVDFDDHSEDDHFEDEFGQQETAPLDASSLELAPKHEAAPTAPPVEPGEQERPAVNRGRIEQLLVVGSQVAGRQRRRQTSLYLMLLFTAVGGLTAYYFYLLGNRAAVPVATPLVAMEEADPLPIPDRLLVSDSSTVAAGIEAVADDSPGTGVAVNQGALMNAKVPPELEVKLTTGDKVVAGMDKAHETGPGFAGPSDAPDVSISRQEALQIQHRDDQPPSRRLLMSALAGDGPVVEQVFSRRPVSPSPDTTAIRMGYTAFQRGDYGLAEKHYQDALAIVASNRDALLGVAAIAAAQNNLGKARQYYRRLLQIDPLDQDARVGLLATIQRQQGHAGDDVLNAMISEYPDDPRLSDLKGMRHASRSQWSMAQSAFFRAHTLDYLNPNYAYNLAVALDHLGQRDAALQYYAEALRLAASPEATAQASFDHEVAGKRVATMGSVQ